MAGWGLPVRRHRGGIHLDFTAWLKDAANETRVLRFAAAAAETLCLRGAADAPSGCGMTDARSTKAPRRRRSVPEIAA